MIRTVIDQLMFLKAIVKKMDGLLLTNRLFGPEFFIALGIGVLISGGIIAIHSYNEDFWEFFRKIV
jgi:hypothetical protein